jgi:hypothetical protein
MHTHESGTDVIEGPDHTYAYKTLIRKVTAIQRSALVSKDAIQTER